MMNLVIKKKMNRSIEEYENSNGWSSHLFAKQASKLFKDLKARGIKITVGRSVIYVGEKENLIKCYVHHNGRSKEYVTFTNAKGKELLTAHYTEFDKIIDFFGNI